MQFFFIFFTLYFFNCFLFFSFIAIYSGDYYLFDTTDSEFESEDQVEAPTATQDLSLTTPPQQTSEQVKDQPDTSVSHEDVDLGNTSWCGIMFF